MDGGYTETGPPKTLAACDDRELEVAEDGTFEWRFGPELGIRKGSTLIIREVYDDWNTEERGTIRIQRLDTPGPPRGAFRQDRVAKRHAVAARMQGGWGKTWFAVQDGVPYTTPVKTQHGKA